MNHGILRYMPETGHTLASYEVITFLHSCISYYMLAACSIWIQHSMNLYVYSSDAGDQVVRVVPESCPAMPLNYLSQVHAASGYNMVCTKTGQDSNDDSIAMLLTSLQVLPE